MFFKIVSPIADKETIATGKGIRESRRLRKLYGGKSWRKLKGTAAVELADGTMFQAEIHWYEAHGIGKKEIRVKHFWEHENK